MEIIKSKMKGNLLQEFTADYLEKHKDLIEFVKKETEEQLALCNVVNCVYVVTELDEYGEQLFKGVFSSREKAIEHLTEQGLRESNFDEINEIELD